MSYAWTIQTKTRLFDHEKINNMNDVTVLPKKKFSPVPITSGLGPERAILERIVKNQKWFTHKNYLNLELELHM